MLCKYCGAVIPEDGGFCPVCGKVQSAPAQAYEPAEKTDKKKSENTLWWILSGVALLLLLISLLVFAVRAGIVAAYREPQPSIPSYDYSDGWGFSGVAYTDPGTVVDGAPGAAVLR